MEVALLATVVALIKKIVEVFKYLTNGDVNGVATQVFTWAAGVGVLWVASEATLFQTIAVNGVALGALNFGAIVLIGMSVASVASVAHDFIVSRDSSVSNRNLKLLPGAKGSANV